MEHGSLRDMQPGLCHRAICSRVSRLWGYQGGIEHGSVKLLHMVLRQCNQMSALVPTHVLPAYLDVLHGGLVCTLTHYFVALRQPVLNMVDAPLMIIFRQGTIVRPVCVPQDSFPKWIYKLMAINKLPPANETPTYFVVTGDVLGVITGISPLVSYNVPGIIGTIRKINVLLSDSTGHEISITLWGEATNRFDGQAIHSLGQEKPIIDVFVGMTVRVYGGSKQLVGGSACRWYINENIPDINDFRSSHLSSFNPIISLPAPHETVLQQQNAVPIWKIPLAHLINFNSYEKKDSQFRCTVRIFRFTPGSEWWITCCTRCNRLAVSATFSSMQPDVYTCSHIDCPCTTATLLYRLCLISTDTTGEAEFIVRGNAAQIIVGLSPYEIVKRNHDSVSPVINMYVAASQIRHTPSEFSHLSSVVSLFSTQVCCQRIGK